MENEKTVLKSPAPLDDGGKRQSKIYIIAAACGMLAGLFIAIQGNAYYGACMLGFGIFGLLIGWGIKNKVMHYKCLKLRTMRFRVSEKPSYEELHQRLLPLFSQLNITMEINEDGSLCIPYKGILYDVFFNEDFSFTVYWRQNMLKTVLRQGYYISIYKKAVVAMGIIAYHVQRVCMNEKALQYHMQGEK